jgi:multicomponent Na+:H+ antiporter subunit B
VNSLILATVSRPLTALLLVFSIFLLLRGHNLPGGGFAGGLVAASAFVLHGLAAGFPAARRMLWFDPRTIMALGLLVAAASGFLGFFYDLPFLTGLWDKTPLPVVGKLGTPLLFDTGVYLLVLGMTCLVVFALGEDD